MKNPKEKEAKLKTKKGYISPILEVVLIEMEQGIAAGSVSVNIGIEVNGDTSAVDTDWGGSDDTTIDTPF